MNCSTASGSRYAKALIKALAPEDVTQAATCLNNLAQAWKLSSALRQLLLHPQVSSQAKTDFLIEYCPELTTSAWKAFLRVVVENHRVSAFCAIADAFEGLLLERMQGLSMTLVTATPLDDAAKQQLQEQVVAVYKGQLSAVRFEVDEKILGGIVYKLRNRVFDSSLKARLRNLLEASLA